MYTPVNPSFFYIKVGCKGVFITRTCVRDASDQLFFLVRAEDVPLFCFSCFTSKQFRYISDEAYGHDRGQQSQQFVNDNTTQTFQYTCTATEDYHQHSIYACFILNRLSEYCSV